MPKYSLLRRHFKLSDILKLVLMQSVVIGGLNPVGYHSVFRLDFNSERSNKDLSSNFHRGISALLTEVKQKSWYLIAFIVAKYVDV